MFGPVIAAVLLAIDGYAPGSNHLTPVAGLLSPGRVTEPRRLTLARVVAAPVEQRRSQSKPALGVVFGFRTILHDLAVLPHQEIVGDSMQDGHQVRWFSVYALELLAVLPNDPEAVWHQARHVRVSELH